MDKPIRKKQVKHKKRGKPKIQQNNGRALEGMKEGEEKRREDQGNSNTKDGRNHQNFEEKKTIGETALLKRENLLH